jgi:hypothetical protein
MSDRAKGRRRRLAFSVASIALVVSLGAAGVTTAAPRNSFTGDFDLVYEGTSTVQGQVKAATFDPTAQRLVPGSFEFKGAPDFFVRETHAQLSHVAYWHDPNHPAPGVGGSDVAFAEGVECYYIAPHDAGCHPWAVMFVEVLDPSHPDQVAFADTRDASTGEWRFDNWMWVGQGEFNVRVAG